MKGIPAGKGLCFLDNKILKSRQSCGMRPSSPRLSYSFHCIGEMTTEGVIYSLSGRVLCRTGRLTG